MKAIIIENCEDCPLCHYSRQRVYCNSAAVATKLMLCDRYLGKILSEPKIPDWCPLSNFTDRMIAYFLSNKIEIPEKLRELTLKEEKEGVKA